MYIFQKEVIILRALEHFLRMALTEDEFYQVAKPEYHDELKSMYPDEFISKVFIVAIKNKRFVFMKEDINKLTDTMKDTLVELAEDKELMNPVLVEIENGVLVVE